MSSGNGSRVVKRVSTAVIAGTYECAVITGGVIITGNPVTDYDVGRSRFRARRWGGFDRKRLIFSNRNSRRQHRRRAPTTAPGKGRHDGFPVCALCRHVVFVPSLDRDINNKKQRKFIHYLLHRGVPKANKKPAADTLSYAADVKRPSAVESIKAYRFSSFSS